MVKCCFRVVTGATYIITLLNLWFVKSGDSRLDDLSLFSFFSLFTTLDILSHQKSRFWEGSHLSSLVSVRQRCWQFVGRLTEGAPSSTCMANLTTLVSPFTITVILSCSIVYYMYLYQLKGGSIRRLFELS